MRRGCARGTDGVDIYGKKSSTFYRSQEIQRKHRTTHKIECRLVVDRKELRKVGSLFQWSFYAGRKAIWHEDIGRVKKIERASKDSKPKLLVWRDKAKDPSRYTCPDFPDPLFDEERDKQAVLAHEAPGMILVCKLMAKLLGGVYCLVVIVSCISLTSSASICKIEVQEVAIRPRACRYTEFVSRIAASENHTSLGRIFRATLKDGPAFATGERHISFKAARENSRLHCLGFVHRTLSTTWCSC